MGGVIRAATYAWRLTLDGAEAVPLAFAAVGKAANTNMNVAANATEVAAASLAKLTTNLGGVSKQIEGLSKLRTELAAIAGVGGLALIVKNSLDVAGNMQQLAAQTGFSTKSYQELVFALMQYNVHQDEATAAMRNFSETTTEFVMHNAGSAKEVYETLFGVKDAQKIAQQGLGNIDKFFVQVLDRIGKLQSEGQKILFLKDLMSKMAGPGLASAANDGAAAIEAFRQQAEKLGIVMSDTLIDKANNAQDKIESLAKALHISLAVAIDENSDDIARVADLLINAVPMAAHAAVIAVGSIKTAWDLLKIAVLGTADVMLHGLDGVINAERRLANVIPGVHVSERTGLEGSMAWIEKQIADSAGDIAHTGNMELGKDDGGLLVTVHPRSGSAQGTGGTTPPPRGDDAAAAKAKQEAEAYAKLTQNLNEEIAAMGTSEREMFISTEQRKLSVDATKAQKDAVAQLAGKLFDEKQQWEEVKSAATATGNAVSTALEDAIVKGKSFHDVLRSLAQTLEDIAYKFFIGDPLSKSVTSLLEGSSSSSSSSGGGIFSGIMSLFGGGKADGGPLDPGKWYIAGEHGPEPIWGGGPGAYAAGYPSGGATAARQAGPVFNVDMRGASVDAVARLEQFVHKLNGSIESRALYAMQQKGIRTLNPGGI
jgi:hypothetical protein